MGSSHAWRALDLENRQDSSALGVDDIRHILAQSEPRGLPFHADPDDLSAVGWGVIVDRDVPSQIRQALEPLVDLRRQQAGDLFQELPYAGEEPAFFLRQYGGGRGRGPLDPRRLPYYLLLVGDAENLSFDLQFALDQQRAVGRVHFESPDDAGRWAQSVTMAEETTVEARLSVFAPSHDDDRLTESSVAHLASPLADEFAEQSGWQVTRALARTATKSRLKQLLDDPGGLFFSAGHAMRYDHGHRRQTTHQGSLVCADWPGPDRWRGPLIDDFLFGAEDLSPESRLAGCIAFCYACYSLGTPRYDLFVRPNRERLRIAERPFLSRLSQRMLRHPQGGLAALVGYVDQTFESSFRRLMDGQRITTFVSALSAVARGHRLGGALECFAQRYAELATDIAESLWTTPEAEMSEEQLQQLDDLWHAFQDARSFGVLGDPAARLQIGDPR